VFEQQTLPFEKVVQGKKNTRMLHPGASFNL